MLHPQVSDTSAHTAPLSQGLLATMADHAEQFLGAAYDVLMSNVRKVCSQSVCILLNAISIWTGCC